MVASVDRPEPPATEADIEAFEELVGPLPGDYLDWMRQHNGGELAPGDLYYMVPCEHSYAPMVTSIHTMDLARRATSGANWPPGQRPAGFADFAHDSGACLYLIDLRPATYGSIWLQDTDQDAIPELGQDPLTWWDNMTRVADSFTDFLNRLVLTRWDPDTQTLIPVEEAE